MGNANGREVGDAGRDGHRYAAADPGLRGNFLLDSRPPVRPTSSAPPSRLPILSVPQVAVASFPRGNVPPFLNHIRQNESHGIVDQPPERQIPVILTWHHGGNHVCVEGSWDNWTHRQILQRSGKDYSILMVLPLGIYHYKFVVDGQPRYLPEFPHVANEMGHVYNLLDVNDYVPEIPKCVTEFEAPPSPDSSYGQSFLTDEDFAKEPVAVPSLLHLTVLNKENSNVGTPSNSKPKHVVLNHVFTDENSACQSVIGLGLTHRFQSKYVTVVLYKPQYKK
ncbi:SNF1-related protein kinase regulatory subunit beta-1-like isoform X2 [Prosopis cineraria]|uniref:SNF1-related protein kinase regulatory subunit beta-1-like isoform X2 n=1 Tax=Prosopis cineraria TaxID=364024 RepID=UPI00240F1260|nr:SNF1-related protein kinase regulatory subunit beta-1-like isoform X2 [Prosopis cineraria]